MFFFREYFSDWLGDLAHSWVRIVFFPQTLRWILFVNFKIVIYMPSCFQSFSWTQKELWGTHTLKLLSFYHHNYVDLSFSPDFFFLSFFFFFFSYFSQTKKLCFLWRVEGRDPVVNEANCCQEEDWFMDFYVLPRLYSAKMTRSKLKTRPRQSVPSLHLPPRTSFPEPSQFILSLFPSSSLLLSF